DRDANGDGIDDSMQSGDTNMNGIPDWRENDVDGDNIPNSVEIGGDPMHPADTDGDGTPDFMDLDSDGDTIPDPVEGNAAQPDQDMDGMDNFRDTDSDGDGTSDNLEAGDGDLTTPPNSCNMEWNPTTRSPFYPTPDGGTPTPYLGDGIPDYLDVDSDN